MEFIIDKPWKFDEKYAVPLTIKRSLNLNNEPYRIYGNTPQQKQITRNIGFFGGGPISLHMYTPRMGCVSFEKLPLQVIVSNNSSTHVEKVKFTLRKIIYYNSIVPARVTREEIVKVMKKEAGGVDKKSEQKYEHNIEIPDLPSTDYDISKIIHIRYEIQVEAKISGLHKNLIEKLPLVVATVPMSAGQNIGLVQMPMPSEARPPVVSMPMPVLFPDLPSSDPPQYPSLMPYPSIPSAPPLDFSYGSPNSTRSSICSSQWDTPPSYNDVYGSPSQRSTGSSQRSSFIGTDKSSLPAYT